MGRNPPRSGIGGIVSAFVMTAVPVFLLWMAAQFLNAQVFSSLDAPFEDGHVAIPGSATVQLPAGQVKVFLQDGSDAIGNPDVVSVTVVGPRPDERVAVVPDLGEAFQQGGGGGRTSVGGPTFRRIAVVDVPAAGDYVISTVTNGDHLSASDRHKLAVGGFSLGRVDFGQERPLTGTQVTLIALGLQVVGTCGLLLYWRRRARQADSG